MTPTHEAPVLPDPDANARFVLGNIAANGRLFVALVVAVDVALYLGTRQGTFALAALTAILGVGVAILADRANLGAVRSILSHAASALPAAALLATTLKVIF